jgi:hypothetical protein
MGESRTGMDVAQWGWAMLAARDGCNPTEMGRLFRGSKAHQVRIPGSIQAPLKKRKRTIKGKYNEPNRHIHNEHYYLT